MTLQDEIIGTLEELEADLGTILITPTGRELPCVPSMEEVGSTVEVGPQLEVITMAVRVRKSLFVTADNTVITADSDVILADNSTGRARSGGANYRTGGFRGKNYRVLKVDEDPTGAYFKIFMGSAR